MISLPNTRILLTIYESKNSYVFRGLQDDCPIIIKYLQKKFPSAVDLVHYRQEFEITQHLASVEGVINTYTLERYENSLFICLEDIGAESLTKLLSQQSFSLTALLNISINVADILLGIHQKNVIHKDINPSNIIFNQNTKIVKIIDFGIATELPQQNLEVKNNHVLEGTLAYLSPEQTGRMNQALDYRTDFYSFGVTLYQLFTGELPFQCEDSMAMIHSHIAVEPTRPDRINPNLPAPIADVILKLLEKTPEKRYQSAQGIKSDLEKCLLLLENSSSYQTFQPGEEDQSDRLQIPQKLYGRKKEIKQLLAIFKRAAAGACELVLVSGYSGIGKSALVKEIYKPLTQRRGYLITGKFDQFQRNIPYHAIVLAFTELMQQLLTENKNQLERWKKKILQAVGSNGQVIIDVIPAVGQIIGSQEPLPPLSPTETQNRLNRIFQRFIEAFCHSDHPLVIFLDDLQWADLATLNLLKIILTQKEFGYLYCIFSFRDNEVDLNHPLTTCLSELKNHTISITKISLTSLKEVDISQLLVDSLHCDTTYVVPLTRIIIQKTHGNPFFINQFLHTLFDEGLLYFTPRTASKQGAWQWDIKKIDSMNITDNVVDLMAAKLQRLPSAAQQIIHLAACIGNQFDLSTLSIISEKSQADTFQNLLPALKERLILSTSNLEIIEDNILSGRLSIQHFKFLHDRVQQAAYTIAEHKKQKTHITIGRLLLKNTTKEKFEDNIFAIADHFYLGTALLVEQHERLQIAKINLQAAQKSKTATAYATAIKYFVAAQSLLANDSWITEYDLTLAIHLEGSEAAFLGGNVIILEDWLGIALKNAATILDKVKVYEVKIAVQISQMQYSEAIRITLKALPLFGITFPYQPTKNDVKKALSKTRCCVKNRKIEDLANLPLMSEPQKVAAMRIMGNATLAAYFGAPELYILMTLKMVRLSIQYGNTPPSTFAYCAYAIILCGPIADFDVGYEFGQLALTIVDKLRVKTRQARTIHLVNCFVNPWKIHLKDTITALKQAYQIGLDTGDHQFSGYAALTCCEYLFFMGRSLSDLDQTLKAYLQTITGFKHHPCINYMLIYDHSISCLLCNPSKTNHDIPDVIYALQKANDRHGMFHFYLNELLQNFWFDDYHNAVKNADIAEKYVANIHGHSGVTVFFFYDSLARLAIYFSATDTDKKGILEKIESTIEKMQRWTKHAPMNNAHRLSLVQAELYRALGDNTKAMNLYDKAILQAQENEYTNDLALANELAGKFWLAQEKQHFAQIYLISARYAYQRWGATKKVAYFDKTYGQWLPNGENNPPHYAMTSLARATTQLTPSSTLDFTSVTKASLILSSEIVFSKLLETMLRIVIENAGAETGFLLLPKNDRWYIEAEGHASNHNITVLKSIEIQDGKQLATQVVRFVEHTKKALILDDIMKDSRFIIDTYVARFSPKSVLCAPLLNKGKLIALLYLENNLATGVFTPDRWQVLNVLMAQIAISMENATLYSTLEQKVAERTKALSKTLDDLKETQDQLIESEKMASLGNLVAGVAHEINTPLGVSITAISCLSEHANTLVEMIKSSKISKKSIMSSINAINQSSDLISRCLHKAANLVMTFKGIAVDHASEEKCRINLREFINQIIISLQPKLQKTKHRIHILCPENAEITSYPGCLSQIFTNLIMNTLLHAYEEYEQGQLQIKIEIEDELLLLSYSDDGRGIPEDHIDKIFDPFFTTKRGMGGIGLGLHILYNMITQKFHGQISCKSIPYKSTSFFIKLPLSKDDLNKY